MNKLGKFTQKSKYLLKCIMTSYQNERFICPNCGYTQSKLIDTKAIFSQLKECGNCQLRFRTPTDSLKDNHEYYQNKYSLKFTTNMPNQHTLEKLLVSKFENHEKSYKQIISLLKIFYSIQAKIFDFGCSWGYGSWQLKEAGFSVLSYEISKPRSYYASKNLSIDIVDISKTPEEIDIFFSNHVLEHVPSPSQTIALARKMLKPDGIFVAITPNGSDSYRTTDYVSWHSLWGQDHPNHLSDTFYKQEFKDNPFILSSMLYSHSDISQWKQLKNQVILPCFSSELLVIAYPNLRL